MDHLGCGQQVFHPVLRMHLRVADHTVFALREYRFWHGSMKITISVDGSLYSIQRTDDRPNQLLASKVYGWKVRDPGGQDICEEVL
jgi:hypothetical protein